MKLNTIGGIIILCFNFAFGNKTIPWPPKEDYFVQVVDHYNFQAANVTFKQRYLYDDTHFEKDGVIFFYCGNEGDIGGFWNNTGFLFELAPTFKALVLFAEHRYYGKSLPFTNSFQQPYIQYLSINQALTDYAYLIEGVKEKFNSTKSHVIAFGGSYGGMLAAYMRLKFPHIVTGSLAASAPVRWVSGEGNFHEFFEAVTKDYFQVDPKCTVAIKNAFAEVLKIAQQGPQGYQKISSDLRLCKPVSNPHEVAWVLKWARNAFVMMSMVDYPYKASFMGDLPAYPVNVSCKNAIKQLEPLASFREAVAVFYNASQDVDCFNYQSQYIECADITGCGLGNDSLAWDFQSCTEMHLYDESESTPSDMFVTLPLTKDQLIAYCQSKWGVTPAFKQLELFFPSSIFKATSNIIFSNGNLDPWMNGGILSSPSSKLITLTIDGGAHHLDLRSSDQADPPSARTVRQTEAETIANWLSSS